METDVKLPTRRYTWEQSDVECCTSCALSACIEAKYPNYDRISPIFHYQRSGARPDVGLTVRSAFVAERRHGLTLFGLHSEPITRRGLAKQPTFLAIQDARRRKLSKQPRLLRAQGRALDIYRALLRKNPVFLEIWRDDGYKRLEQPGVDEWIVSGSRDSGQSHTVAIIGFEARTQRFIAKDSRGTQFGRCGQWYVHAKHLDKPTIIGGREIR